MKRCSHPIDKWRKLWHDRANLETGEFKQEVESMSDLENKVEKVADDSLKEVVGGVSANYLAALDVMNGKYGNGEERKRRLTAAGYDYWAVQHLVNSWQIRQRPVSRQRTEKRRLRSRHGAGYRQRNAQVLIRRIAQYTIINLNTKREFFCEY